jgi:hypothetical protein
MAFIAIRTPKLATPAPSAPRRTTFVPGEMGGKFT